MPQIHIRPAIAEDIPVLMQIPHHSQAPIVWQMEKFEEEGEETVIFRQVRLPRPARLDYPRPSTYLEKGWTEFTTMAVAQLNGDLVGYIGIRENKGTGVVWVSDLVVAESFRRQGIGSALVLSIQAWAVQLNLRMMTLEMQAKNYPMIRLAIKLGYKWSGFLDHYYPNLDIGLFFSRSLR
ncbi:MAG TPA: GNAT family N-acetyltransferase [Anaerolineaceae bacterium]|nr:GNAT family N-acetyltransferase [Anaerolineaceae bacterium]HPA33214.1 GNAT family N-acetyltransferase [Anaerolineaceae bacterium]HQF45465.1 GNAT family N-acetyltransferase [Anaerolineaceae bacterium]HQH35387.1 GNAT family N-acetyltransferase [Anaerolineaceae bacterium]HQP61088.1 GNAT family N-acetyltransferase [Anaerolineaceae bacterium]